MGIWHSTSMTVTSHKPSNPFLAPFAVEKPQSLCFLPGLPSIAVWHACCRLDPPFNSCEPYIEILMQPRANPHTYEFPGKHRHEKQRLRLPLEQFRKCSRIVLNRHPSKLTNERPNLREKPPAWCKSRQEAFGFAHTFPQDPNRDPTSKTNTPVEFTDQYNYTCTVW
jgi:hypothetical protein